MIPFLADSSACGVPELVSIFYYATVVITVLQIAVPFALIIWGTLDLLKGIIAGDEKKISAAKKPFIQRLISAVIVFLIPWISNMAINLFVDDAVEWKACYNAAKNDENKGLGGVSHDPGSQSNSNTGSGSNDSNKPAN